MQVAMIPVMCTPANSAHADPELVGGDGGGWSCMLLLHPALTCTDAGSDLCILHPELYTLWLQWLSPAAAYSGAHGVSPWVVGTNTQLAHVMVSLISWQLALVVFSFHPLVHIPYLHSSNLHCVVVVWQCMYIAYKWKTSWLQSLITMDITDWLMNAICQSIFI